MKTVADIAVLEVLLYDESVGTLTRVSGDRSLFAFNEDYIENEHRPVLGLRFKDELGQLITEFRPYQTRVMPFFSNLLPEDHLRDYLAERAGVNPVREFFLLWVLGQDLPGAITIKPFDGEAWLPNRGDQLPEVDDEAAEDNALRFSLAGVQLKFSAVNEASGGLTIPAKGVGGSWIVKLPSGRFKDVPENEFSMMTLARNMGMDVPATELVDVHSIGGLPEGIGALKGQALAVERFDRLAGDSIHTEDFAQVFGVYPEKKYEKASYTSIARVVGLEGQDRDVAEFIRRLVFNALIGNADMHLKNWSLIYSDRRTPALAPAYDFVSTIKYLPDESAALKFSRTKRFDELTEDEISHLAAKAKLPEKLVLDTARETVSNFHEHWKKEKAHLPLSKEVVQAIDGHIRKIPIAHA